MMFTIEFFRIRESDNAHATLDRISHIATDLESAKSPSVDFSATRPRPARGFSISIPNHS